MYAVITVRVESVAWSPGPEQSEANTHLGPSQGNYSRLEIGDPPNNETPQLRSAALPSAPRSPPKRSKN